MPRSSHGGSRIGGAMDTIIDQKSMEVPDTREVKDLASDYGLFKRKLDQTLNETVSGFVRTGYLLKIARDTNVLDGSTYSTLSEFAAKEYNLRPDEVSRFIAINDKYSVNGYSPELMEQYRGYGYSKLAEMLTLPPALAEMIKPETTREDIRMIKQEYAQAQEETPIELAIEEQAAKEEQKELLQNENIEDWVKDRMPVSDYGHILFENFRGPGFSRTRFLELWDYQQEGGSNNRRAWEILVPSDSLTIIQRIPGKGKMFLNLKGDFDAKVVIVNRAGQKEEISAENILGYALKLTEPVEGITAKEAWSRLYQEEWQEQEDAEAEEKQEKKKPEKKNPVTVVKEKPMKLPKSEKKEIDNAQNRANSGSKEVVSKKEQEAGPVIETDTQEEEQKKPEIAPAQNENRWKQLSQEDFDLFIKQNMNQMQEVYSCMESFIAKQNWEMAESCFRDMEKLFDRIMSRAIEREE